MNKQEDFYDILRSKFNNRDIPAEESDWKKMRKTIDDSRKRKRRIVWTIIPLAALLLGFGIYEFFSASKNEPVVNKSEIQSLAENNANTPGTTNSERPENDKPGMNAEKTTADKVNSAGRSTQNEANNQEKPTSPATSAVTLATKTQKPATANNHIENDRTLTAANKSNNLSFSASNRSSSTSVKGLEPVGHNPSKENVVKGDADNQTKPGVKTAMENNKKEEETPAQNQQTSLQTVPQAPNNLAAAQQAQLQNSSPDIKAGIKQDSANNRPTSAIPALVNKVDSNQKKGDTGLHTTSPQQVASLPPLEEKAPGTSSLSVEIGGGYSFGWKYGDTSQGNGICPTLGIGYTKELSQKWSVKTGVQLNVLDGMGTSSLVIKHTSYDFQYNANDTTVTTKWLLYLTVPLQLEYKLNEKNAIGIGGAVSYLVTEWGKVDTYITNGISTQANTNSYTQYMHVNGYNQWDASIYLLYKRNLFGQLYAYIMPYYGLMDIKSNSFFMQNKFERNSGIKLLLSYSIF